MAFNENLYKIHSLISRTEGPVKFTLNESMFGEGKDGDVHIETDDEFGSFDDLLNGNSADSTTPNNGEDLDFENPTSQMPRANFLKDKLASDKKGPNAEMVEKLNKPYDDSSDFKFVVSEFISTINGNGSNLYLPPMKKQNNGNPGVFARTENRDLTVYDAHNLLCDFYDRTDTTRKYLNDRPNSQTYGGDMEALLGRVKDYRHLHILLYDLFVYSRADKNNPRSAIRRMNQIVKDLIIELGLITPTYSLTLDGKNIPVCEVMDDPFAGNTNYKTGLAMKFFEPIMNKYNRSDKEIMAKLRELWGRREFENVTMSIGEHDIYSATDVLAFLLEKVIETTNGTDFLNPTGQEGSRRMKLFESHYKALKIYQKSPEEFKGVSVLAFLDDSYTFEQWLNECKQGKCKYAGDVEDISKIIAYIETQQKGTKVNTDSETQALTVLDKYGNPVVTSFSDFVYDLYKRKVVLEDNVGDILGGIIPNWDKQVNSNQGGLIGDGNQFSGLGDLSLDYASNAVGVAIEVQGSQHFTSFSALRLNQADLPAYNTSNMSNVANSVLSEESIKGNIHYTNAIQMASINDLMFKNILKKILVTSEITQGEKLPVKLEDIIREARSAAKKANERGQLNGWVGKSNTTLEKVYEDQMKTYCQQMKDKWKSMFVNNKDFKSGVKWEMLYICEKRGIDEKIVQSTMEIPYIANFGNKDGVTYLGPRNTQTEYAQRELQKCFYEPNSNGVMPSITIQNFTLNDEINKRAKLLNVKL